MVGVDHLHDGLIPASQVGTTCWPWVEGSVDTVWEMGWRMGQLWELYRTPTALPRLIPIPIWHYRPAVSVHHFTPDVWLRFPLP